MWAAVIWLPVTICCDNSSSFSKAACPHPGGWPLLMLYKSIFSRWWGRFFCGRAVCIVGIWDSSPTCTISDSGSPLCPITAENHLNRFLIPLHIYEKRAASWQPKTMKFSADQPLQNKRNAAENIKIMIRLHPNGMSVDLGEARIIGASCCLGMLLIGNLEHKMAGQYTQCLAQVLF